MEQLSIRCDRCKQRLTHICKHSLKRAIARLWKVKLEVPPHRGFFNKRNGYVKGDEEQPFFSEAYLYNLVGKHDARTILAVVNDLIRACGIEPADILRWESDREAKRQTAEQRASRQTHYIMQSLTGVGTGGAALIAEKDKGRVKYLIEQALRPSRHDDEDE